MKIALYIEDGTEQIVLTPQSDTEKNILDKFRDKSIVKMYRGEFYACQGGWIRQGLYLNGTYSSSDDSLIMVIQHPELKENYGYGSKEWVAQK